MREWLVHLNIQGKDIEITDALGEKIEQAVAELLHTELGTEVEVCDALHEEV